jgi:N-acetylglucosaminyldiphosphoundecaprenol N-acetyl-beta-D-mannosaminyltransferase
MIASSTGPGASQPLTDAVRVLGYPVSNLTLEEAVARVADFTAKPSLHHIVVINTNKIWLASHTPELSEILHRAEMAITEYGPVWASRVLRTPLKANIRGIGLLQALLPWLERQCVPIYLLGGRESVLRPLLDNLLLTHPDLVIAGTRNGYFQPAEESAIIDHINTSGAAVLFVAMGSPRQELFIERHRATLQIRVAMGVGGSFDVLAGLKRDAPPWMHHGTEWIYRLWQDPKTLWKRYLQAHPWFIYRILRDKAARVAAPLRARKAH